MTPHNDARAQWVADQEARARKHGFTPLPPVEDDRPVPAILSAAVFTALWLAFCAGLAVAAWFLGADAAEAKTSPRHEWWIGGTVSWVEVHEPEEPGALATVTFQNRNVHGKDERFSLTWQGLLVEFHLDYNADDRTIERLTVIPPDGMVAIPQEIDVEEDMLGRVHIFTAGPMM